MHHHNQHNNGNTGDCTQNSINRYVTERLREFFLNLEFNKPEESVEFVFISNCRGTHKNRFGQVMVEIKGLMTEKNLQKVVKRVADLVSTCFRDLKGEISYYPGVTCFISLPSGEIVSGDSSKE